MTITIDTFLIFKIKVQIILCKIAILHERATNLICMRKISLKMQ